MTTPSGTDIFQRNQTATPLNAQGIAAELDRLGLPQLPEALPSPVVDDHTHADATAEYSGLDPELSLQASAAVGVTRWVQVGCDLESSQWAVDFARSHPQVIAAVAMHPNDAARLVQKQGMAALDDAMTQIDELAGAHDRVQAIGETGLDYFRTRQPGDQVLQRDAFARHIELAKKHQLTLVIHDRDAHHDVMDVLDAEGWPERVVFHCFSADADFARQCCERGAWLSFGGALTFKANNALREAFTVTPVEQVLVETDAPYLTPVPTRGKPNAPYLVPHIVRFMAGLHLGSDAPENDDALARYCHQINHNTEQAYGGAWPDAENPRPPEAIETDQTETSSHKEHHG